MDNEKSVHSLRRYAPKKTTLKYTKKKTNGLERKKIKSTIILGHFCIFLSAIDTTGGWKISKDIEKLNDTIN